MDSDSSLEESGNGDHSPTHAMLSPPGGDRIVPVVGMKNSPHKSKATPIDERDEREEDMMSDSSESASPDFRVQMTKVYTVCTGVFCLDIWELRYFDVFVRFIRIYVWTCMLLYSFTLRSTE